MIEDAVDKVQRYNFRRMGYIGPMSDLSNNRSKRPVDCLTFVVDTDAEAEALYTSPAPALYVWLSKGQASPWYVGKAGNGLRARWRQWTDGFYGTANEREKFASGGKPATGLGMAERIRRQPARSVEVWARPAGTITLLGISGTLVSAEEEMLIKLLEPRWNGGKDDLSL